ncbi:hypothetical protein HYV43_06040 [Candidatus Micrarchaeota archaeon]|nr:hypothetical protein [Candidatus Micrarchaeota archaeon]
MHKVRAVADSSVLITFAKSKKLDWLLDTFETPLWIPPAVYDEAVTMGLEKKEPDARVIDAAVQRKSIQVRKVKKRLELPFLDAGESSVLALALENRLPVVCIDEAPARSAAKSLGLNPIGTLGVFFILLKRKRINQLQALALVEDMVRRDFRISAKILERFRKETTLL